MGRDRELARLGRLATGAATGVSAAVTVIGEPGIGKTSLLRAAASATSLPVLSVSGVEDAGTPAYAALAELCAPVRDQLGALAPVEAQSLAAALGWAAQHETPAVAQVGSALLRLMGATAAGDGLLVIVDDADFLDPASLEALAVAARRANREGVVLVFAARPSGPGQAALRGLPSVQLAGLPPRFAEALLVDRGHGPLDPQVAERMVAEAAGNPLILTELAETLSADQLAGRQPLPRPLPVGNRLKEVFADRTRELPGPAALAIVAAAAGFGNLAVLADGLARLGLTEDDLRPAEEAGLVALGGGQLVFRHPLVRSAVYYSAAVEERRAVHRALAEANGAVAELERQAWHLARALSGPDEGAAALIVSAAHASARRGGRVEAAAALEDAARLSSDPDRRAARLLEAAEMWFLAGRIEQAKSMAEDLLAQELGQESTARAALVRGRALLVSGSEEEGRHYLMDQAEQTTRLDPDLAVCMAVAAASSAQRAGALGEAREAARAAADWSVRATPQKRQLADLVLGAVQVMAGAGLDGRARLVEAMTPEGELSHRLATEHPVVATCAPLALIWAEDYGNARLVLERMEAIARAQRLLGVLPAVLTTRALLEHRVSQPLAAEARAAEALELALETGQQAVAPYAAAILATAEAILGRAESCRERCQALLASPASGVPTIRSGALSALGLLELGEGRPDEAVRWYEVLAGIGGSPAHPGIVMWGADLAEAYLQAGRGERARVVVDQLAQRAQATGNVRAVGAVRRVRAQLCDDDEEAEVLFAAALRHYGGPEWALARARIELARGLRLARAGRRSDAERRLSRALGLFREIGAEGWGDRAAEALARLGVRTETAPEAVGALSPVERQVALAVAMGGEPRDIASGLFLGEATVLAALDSATAKLGVGGPEGLVGKLGQLVSGGWGRGTAAPEPARGESVTAAAGAPSGGPITRLRLLGDAQVLGPTGATGFPSGQVGELLKRLALARRLPMEELVEELWPEAPPGAGRNRLRTLLSRVRQQVGALVVRQEGWVALAPEVEVDAQRFEELAGAAQRAAPGEEGAEDRAGQLAREALAIYQGELLPVDRHLDFTTAPRERLRRRYLAMVAIVVEDLARHHDTQGALGLLETALDGNRHEEGLYLRAAALLAGSGRGAEAAAMIRQARAALDELGLPLSPRGEELAKSLD